MNSSHLEGRVRSRESKNMCFLYKNNILLLNLTFGLLLGFSAPTQEAQASFGIQLETRNLEFMHHVSLSVPYLGNDVREKSTMIPIETPIAGRPWMVVSSDIQVKQSENTEDSRYEIRYLPSASNVERIEIHASANAYRGVTFLFWGGHNTKLELSFKTVLQSREAINNAEERSIQNEKIRRVGVQIDQLNGIKADFYSRLEEVRQKLLDQLQQASALANEKGNLPEKRLEVSRLIQSAEDEFDSFTQSHRNTIERFIRSWRDVNDGLKLQLRGQGIAPLDPSAELQANLELRALDDMREQLKGIIQDYKLACLES